MGFITLTHADRKTAQNRKARQDGIKQVRKLVDQALTERELDQLEFNIEQERRTFILAGGNPDTKQEFPTVSEFWDAVKELDVLSDDEKSLAYQTEGVYYEQQWLKNLYENDPFYADTASSPEAITV